MRPVNLIPAEERRGDATDLRTGSFIYVLVGGLAVLMIGIIAVAFTSKQISDREAEKAELQAKVEEETAKAESLRAFSDFRGVQESRSATVVSLAESRFDWERVIKEFSLILPDDVWLVNMTGTVSPGVQVQNGAEVTIRDSVPGPALELVGCAPSEEAVAGFIASLEDIDGVTRVGVQEAEQPGGDESASSPSGGASEGVDDCRTNERIYKFEIVVAFDAVPTPETATAAPGVPPAAGGTATPAGSTAPPSNMNQQIDQSQQATNVIPGG